MSLRADVAQRRLLRALGPAIGEATVIATRSVPWSSATFEGARHRIALRLDGADAKARAAAIAAGIGEAEIALRGAFVADITVTTSLGDPPAIAIEALTIDEPPDGDRDAAALDWRGTPDAAAADRTSRRTGGG